MSPPAPGTEPSQIETRWRLIAQQRSTIAESLDAAAGGAVGAFSKHLTQLARRVGRIEPERWNRHDVDVLTFCSPLMSGVLRPDQTDELVGHYREQWLATSDRDGTFATLAYPLVTAAVCLLLFAVFCLTVVKEFQRMFDEFGLDLPAPTKFLFWISGLLETWWPILPLLLVVVVLVAAISRLAARRIGSVTVGQWLTRRVERSRVAIQKASLRLSTLTAGDLPRHDAVRYAAAASGRRWLRRWLTDWSDQLIAIPGRKPAIPASILERLRRDHGGLLAVALQLPREPCVDGLRVTAAMTGDRQRHSMKVLGFVLGELIVFSVGAMVALLVITLFMPLVSLISGLT